MTTSTRNAAEKPLGDLLSRLIYAVFDDIETSMGQDFVPLAETYWSYKYLCLDKDELPTFKLKSRFVVTDQVRQCLSYLFNNFISEITDAALTSSDSLASIIEKTKAAAADCHIEHMFAIASGYTRSFGESLIHAIEPNAWADGYIIGKMTAAPVAGGIIIEQFHRFVRVLAITLGQLMWYRPTSVDKKLFYGAISVLGFPKMIVDQMDDSLRPCAPKTSKKTSIFDSIVPPNAPATTATSTSTRTSTIHNTAHASITHTDAIVDM